MYKAITSVAKLDDDNIIVCTAYVYALTSPATYIQMGKDYLEIEAELCTVIHAVDADREWHERNMSNHESAHATARALLSTARQVVVSLRVSVCLGGSCDCILV